MGGRRRRGATRDEGRCRAKKISLEARKGTSTRMWLRAARTIIKSTILHSGKIGELRHVFEQILLSRRYFRLEGELQFYALLMRRKKFRGSFGKIFRSRGIVEEERFSPIEGAGGDSSA